MGLVNIIRSAERDLAGLGRPILYWALAQAKQVDSEIVRLEGYDFAGIEQRHYDKEISELRALIQSIPAAKSYDRMLGELKAIIASGAYIPLTEKFKYHLPVVVWDDIRITPRSFDKPGVGDPAIVANAPGGGGSIYLPEFEVADIASFTVQLPHGYKHGSDISVHAHWTPGTRGNEESGKLVGWKVDYSWANDDDTFGAVATADLSDACDGTDHKHQRTPEVTISGTGKELSSMMVCNIKRTDTGADDTWVGAISGQLPLLLEVDFHYQIDTIGSREIRTK